MLLEYFVYFYTANSRLDVLLDSEFYCLTTLLELCAATTRIELAASWSVHV